MMTKRWLTALLLMLSGTPVSMIVSQADRGVDDFIINADGEVDIERKMKETKELVLKAVKHFEKVPVEKACNDFIHSPAWRIGDLYVYVYTSKGVCLAYGDDYDFIWRDISESKSLGGGNLVRDLNRVGVKGGTISYLWQNSFKTSYVKSVEKDGITYLLGCGFYPESDEYTVKQLIKTAVAYFQQNGKEVTFSLISNPTGPFVKGDIYMAAYDLNGMTLAHGNNPALVGQNRIDEVDARGKPLIQELIKVARTKGSGWIQYYWRKELKRAYVERVVDPKTKIPYLLTAGYYPNIDFKAAKAYVARAIYFLKANGSKAAFSEFSNLVGEFAQGGLGVVVYDLNGKNLANGENPAFVGQNLLKQTGARGRLYVKDIITQAKKYGTAIVSYTNFNANAIGFFKLVDTPDGKFIIGTEFFPASKQISVQTMVNRAVELLNEENTEKAFAAFSKRDGYYIQGDVHVFVYDALGTRLVNGTQKSQIWRNLLKSTDQLGKAVVNDIITIALNGGGWTEYKVRNATRRVYVKAVPKKLDNGTVRNYIVGSGYFL